MIKSIMNSKCLICGVPLKSLKAKICKSPACYKAHRKATKTPKTKHCLECGTSFTTLDRRNNFCSTKCKAAASNKTKLQKYGTLNLETQESKQTRISKMIATVANKPKELKELQYTKQRQTVINKYGVPNAFLLRDKESWITKKNAIFGGNSPFASLEIRAKAKETILSNHKGAWHLAQNTWGDLKQKLASNNLKLIDPLKEDTEIFGTQDLTNTYREDPNSYERKRITIECFCGNRFTTIFNKGIYATPQSCGCIKSKPQLELYEFIQNILPENTEVLQNKRPSFMNGLELDIWIPSYNLAIEYHSLAYHSERPIHSEVNISKIKRTHALKSQLAEKVGLLLFQIFEDEWRDRPEIVKSMIRNRLNLNTVKIFARKTQVKELSQLQYDAFFRENHINGSVRSIKGYGLYYNNQLVSAITLRPTWNKSYGNVLEIARFATIHNTTVIGGFQKLMKPVFDFAKSNKYEAILTYADRRFGYGKVYEKAGFDFIKVSLPNYYYEKKGVRENRFKHRKSSNLQGQTEREQQNALGWYAIYDAGNNVYLYRL